LSLTACGSSDSRDTVQFHLSKPEAIPYFRELISEYNASQDEVRVVLDTSSNLQAGFLRGNPPDLGLLNYNMEMARFMERGALSDLSDMPEAERILPEVQDLVNQYAVYPGCIGHLQQGHLRRPWA
jgi:raffinose/stachyose/melibiose transport system substrate-binding protein